MPEFAQATSSKECTDHERPAVVPQELSQSPAERFSSTLSSADRGKMAMSVQATPNCPGAKELELDSDAAGRPVC